jgi:hypothetical protein
VLLAPRECTKLTASVEHKGYCWWDSVGHRMRISSRFICNKFRPYYPRPSDGSPSYLVDPLSFLILLDTSISTTRTSRSVPSMTPLLVIPSSVIPSYDVPPVVSSLNPSSVDPDYIVKPPVTCLYSMCSSFF